MLSSPYPVPNDPVWRGLLVVGWLAGVAGGVWVLVYPPQSYVGLGAGLSVLWGLLLIVGSSIVLAGHLLRRHRVELTGLWPGLAGIVLYSALSWQSVVTSPGAGARACLIVLLACLVAGRIRQLSIIEKRVRHIDQMGRGD